MDSFCFQNHINCRENRIPDFRSMDNIPTGFSPHPGNVDRVLLRERTGGPSRDPSRPRLLASGCLTTNQFCNYREKGDRGNAEHPQSEGLHPPQSPQQGKTRTPPPRSGPAWLPLTSQAAILPWHPSRPWVFCGLAVTLAQRL